MDKAWVTDLFRNTLHCVQPENLIRGTVTCEAGVLTVEGHSYHLGEYGEVHLFGSGKASIEMAKALAPLLDGHLTGGLVVCNYSEPSFPAIEVVESSHPIPTEKSIHAAELLMERLSALSQQDFYIFLLSGGSSALLEKPLPPITLSEMQRLMKGLLGQGVPIGEVNAVRKHLSLVKGGRLGRLSKARGLVLVISDVIGDDLETIGSAPLYYDRSRFSDTHDILRAYGLWEEAPDSVRLVIQQGLDGAVEETPKQPNPSVDHVLIGRNLKLLMEVKKRVEEQGIAAHVMTSRLRGEAREVARALISLGEEIASSGHPFPPPVCLLFGGETTVTLRGKGRGGRNQEMALAALREIGEKKGIFFLSAGTDGIDGHSDAAGAVVDRSSYDKARELNLHIDDYLARNDSYHFFEKTGDLIMTGPTGTNVMDMIILLVLPG